MNENQKILVLEAVEVLTKEHEPVDILEAFACLNIKCSTLDPIRQERLQSLSLFLKQLTQAME